MATKTPSSMTLYDSSTDSSKVASCCTVKREIWFVCCHSTVTGTEGKCTHPRNSGGKTKILKVYMGYCPLCEEAFGIRYCRSELFLRRYWAFRRDHFFRSPIHPSMVPAHKMMRRDISDLSLDPDDTWAVEHDYTIFFDQLTKLATLDDRGRSMDRSETIPCESFKFMFNGRVMRNHAIAYINRPITAQDVRRCKEIDAKKRAVRSLCRSQVFYRDFEYNSVYGPDVPSDVQLPCADKKYGTLSQVWDVQSPTETHPFPAFHHGNDSATSSTSHLAVDGHGEGRKRSHASTNTACVSPRSSQDDREDSIESKCSRISKKCQLQQEAQAKPRKIAFHHRLATPVVSMAQFAARVSLEFEKGRQTRKEGKTDSNKDKTPRRSRPSLSIHRLWKRQKVHHTKTGDVQESKAKDSTMDLPKLKRG